MSSKKLALFDIDGTILPLGTATFSLAKDLASCNLMNKTYLQNILNLREDYYTHKKIAYENFATEVFRNFASGLEGKSFNQVLSRSNKFLHKNIRESIYKYTQKVITALLKTYDVYFITANTQFYADFFTKHLGVTGYKSTILEIKNGIFTGKVTDYLTKAEYKDRAIKELINSYPYKGSIAFGDADSDIIMLRSVEIPVCINPRDNLKKEAVKKGWIITDPQGAEKIVVKRLKLT